MFEQGIPLTDELREIFDDCCKHYLSGREKSYATTYDWMLTKYFTARVETQTSDGVVVQNKLLPIDQRPTKSQMENYIVTHTSAKARRVCKTSKREYRNDERMLVSDNLLNVHGPGDLFEMDEVEMDVSIVSEVDPTKVIGRPIVHAMVDVYSRMITAVSASLENNSVLGFTNCLLNLGEDNKQLEFINYDVVSSSYMLRKMYVWNEEDIQFSINEQTTRQIIKMRGKIEDSAPTGFALLGYSGCASPPL